MTQVGKAKLDHPALGTAGGSSLHAAVETIFENISDHLPARWKLFESVAVSTTTTYEHNLQVPLADLRVHIYTKGVSSNTKVSDLAAAGWSVVATTGYEQTKVDITAPSSGGPFDFYVYVSHEPMSDKLDLSGGTMTGTLVLSGEPTQPTHAATKNYVDSVAQGLDVKQSVKCATTANITLSGEQTIDGVAVVAGDRVLVKDQSTASQNGIYEVGAGSWSRASDMDAWTEVPGAFCFVEEGSAGADTGWVCTADQSGTIGTTAVSWSQFAGVGNYTTDGEGLELSGTQFALELDGNTLSKSASGLKVNPSGDITAASLSSGVINATGYQDFSPVAAPSAPTGKLRVYAKADNKLYTKTAAGIEQAVGSGGSVLLISKVGHGFVAADVGCPVYLNASGDYVKARADLSATAEVAGLINKYIDADNFEVCLGGEVTSVGANAASSLTPGEVYFLSASTAGALTATEPTTVGYVSKPVGVARSASAIDFFNMRGVVVGGANARTQITLSNNATTTVQNVSSYDAGELAGWVSLVNSTAASSLRFYVQAPFAKKGNTASPDYFISPSYVGDTPPAGFSMSVTSAGVIQITMPNWSGYSSAVINYALNAPAVGTNFPLAVGGDSVTGGTPVVLGLKASTSAGLNFASSTGSVNSVLNDSGYFGINTTTFTSRGKFNVNHNSATLSTATPIGVTPVGQFMTFSAQIANVNNSVVDLIRFLDPSGTILGATSVCGILYFYCTGVSGVNAASSAYNLYTTGNGTTSAVLQAIGTAQIRGTTPVSSIQIANDGAGGQVKVTVGFINNSGIVTGGYAYASFSGLFVG